MNHIESESSTSTRRWSPSVEAVHQGHGVGSARMVVVVNLYGGSYWVPEANAALAAVVAQYPNAIIADWYAAIDAVPHMLQSDGIHPDIDGGLLYADVVAGAFAELSARLGG